MAVAERYSRNMKSFTEAELNIIAQKRICVIGCGGLGGYVIQSLGRFGVGGLRLVDGDVFAESNLNRQLFSTEHNLGGNKAQVCARELADINSSISVEAIPEMLTDGNAEATLAGCDLAMDCLDSKEARFLLDRHCASLGIPYIHGAIGGFYGQVSTVFPCDNTLEKVYSHGASGGGVEKELGNPPFMPQLVAAIQCSEALKLLCGKGELLRNRLMYIDALYNEIMTIDMS